MSGSSNIKVLIVDDSKLIQKLIESILATAGDIKVVGFANDGQEALELTKKLKPDLITMDISMPHMNGFETTQYIMEHCPTPIIVLSSLVSEDELDTVYRALAAGALGVQPKFFGLSSDEYQSRKREFINSVHALSQVHVIKRRRQLMSHSHQVLEFSPVSIIACGLSTGGPEALLKFLSSLDKSFPVPIVIVMHISKGFLEGFAKWLQSSTKLQVCLPKPGDELLPGHLYFAPDNGHLIVKAGVNNPIAEIDDSPPVKQFKPSITKLFESLAHSYPKRAVAGIFTGMGDDGAQGLLAMRRVGCYTFIQSPDTCVVSGMPESALKLEAVDEQVALEDMASFFHRVVQKRDEHE